MYEDYGKNFKDGEAHIVPISYALARRVDLGGTAAQAFVDLAKIYAEGELPPATGLRQSNHPNPAKDVAISYEVYKDQPTHRPRRPRLSVIPPGDWPDLCLAAGQDLPQCGDIAKREPGNRWPDLLLCYRQFNREAWRGVEVNMTLLERRWLEPAEPPAAPDKPSLSEWIFEQHPRDGSAPKTAKILQQRALKAGHAFTIGEFTSAFGAVYKTKKHRPPVTGWPLRKEFEGRLKVQVSP
jgi:hypothetical protein